MLQAARDQGFNAKGVKASAADLEVLPCPQILFWEFNHFLVLERIDETGAWLNDPAVGPRFVDREQFESSYTGVALQIEPGNDFKKAGNRQSLFEAVRERIQDGKTALLFTVLIGFILTVPNLIVPAFNRVITDYFVLETNVDWFWPMLISLVTIGIAQAVLTWMRDRQLLRLDAKMALVGATSFFWHVLHLPIDYFAHRNVSEVGSRVALNDKIAGTITNRLAVAVLGMMTMAVYALVMAQYNLILTFIAIAFAALNLFALKAVQKSLADGNRRLLVEEARFFTLGSRGLQSVDDLIASGGTDGFINRLSEHQRAIINQRQVMGYKKVLLETLPTLFSTLSIVALILFGGFDVMDGIITVGMLIAFQMLLSLFGAPVTELLGLGSDLQELHGNMERLDDVMAHPAEFSNGEGSRQAAKINGHLAVKDLCFSYAKYSQPALDKIAFTTRPGDCVAVVGTSGSGKSTLAKLLAGLYQPGSGTIEFDGLPRDKIAVSDMHVAVAYVDQEIRMFGGTVTDNLTMSDAPVPHEILTRAAKAACIHDVIMRRPGGYTAKVSADGQNFSGGERQRLELARALVKQPSILILDEATSALDVKTEIQVIEALIKLGITVVFISHRLSALQHFDRILVMKDGQIVDEGTLQALEAREGAFKQLLKGAIDGRGYTPLAAHHIRPGRRFYAVSAIRCCANSAWHFRGRCGVASHACMWGRL